MVVAKRGGGSLGGKTVHRSSGIEKLVIQPNYRNISVFTFLQNGCFEKEYLSYCPTRVTGFSCVHWIDPETSRKSDNRTDTEACITGIYASTPIADSFSCYGLPLFLVAGVPLLVAAIVATRRSGLSFLHFCIYLTLISIFDLFALVILISNDICTACFAVHLLESMTLMSRTACVVTTLVISAIHHTQAALLIVLAVDTWRFARHPLKVNRTLRSEWVKNCSILIATACLFINGQFFWTFDVSEHDNRILHGRAVLRAYECSYANSLLSTTYTSYVWPLIDLGLGSVFPILTCLIFGGWGMHLIKQRRRRCGGTTTGLNLLTLYQSHFIDVDFVFQVLSASALIAVASALLATPEAIYQLWKLVSFMGDKHSKPLSKDKLRVGTRRSSDEIYAQDWRQVEPYHQMLEMGFHLIRAIAIILKPAVLFYKVTRFRGEISSRVQRIFGSRAVVEDPTITKQ